MSEITVEDVPVSDEETWNGLVGRSSQATPFHRHECLEACADHSDTRAHLLAGYTGDEPIGVFPVFSRSYPFASTVFSPPPNLKIPYLGPVLIDSESSGSKQEKRCWDFVWKCLDHLNSTFDPKYMSFRTSPHYPDPRPFSWGEFDVTTKFTYVVDMTSGRADLFDRFGSDARSNVRDCEDANCRIRRGDLDDVHRIFEQVQSRHEALDLPYSVEPSFLTALYEGLPDEVFRPYACYLDGEFVGGNVILSSKDTAYAWIGAATPDVDLGVNDAVHWEAMQDCIDRGETRYDLVGANNQRLSEYKAKFAPTLEIYQSIQKSDLSMKIAEQVYKRVRKTAAMAR